jgi:hypothetical protein
VLKVPTQHPTQQQPSPTTPNPSAAEPQLCANVLKIHTPQQHGMAQQCCSCCCSATAVVQPMLFCLDSPPVPFHPTSHTQDPAMCRRTDCLRTGCELTCLCSTCWQLHMPLTTKHPVLEAQHAHPATYKLASQHYCQPSTNHHDMVVLVLRT